MTAEERVAALHAKMNVRRQARERRKTRAVGAVCAFFAVGLLALVIGGIAVYFGGTACKERGAATLPENAGGCVLLAIAVFLTGVVVTAVLLRRRGKKQERDKVPIERLPDGALAMAAGGKNGEQKPETAEEQKDSD